MSVCNLHQSEYVNASHCLTVIVAWHPSAFGDHECDQFMVHQPLETMNVTSSWCISLWRPMVLSPG